MIDADMALINAVIIHFSIIIDSMLKNYLKIAFRNLLKHKVFSAVNLLGFSLGFIAVIFIALYVIDELSFDQYHSKADRIYRITETIYDENGERQVVGAATRLGPAALANLPEVDDIVRLNVFGRLTLGYDEFRAYENFLVADSSYFKVFDSKIIEGNAETALNQPFSVVLTESLAKKYFGDESPLGKSMYASQFEDEITVTGVIEDFPSNAHFRPSLFFSLVSLSKFDQIRNFLENDWSSNEFATYLLLNEDANPEAVADQLTNLANANRTSEFQNNQYSLQALSDIHFHSQHLDNDYIVHADITYVYIFGGIGLLILLIAFINYVNLSTARAMKRFKEVGLRKTVGASRRQLMYQFIGESILIVLITLILAVTFVQLLMPYFNNLTDKTLELNLFSSSIVLILLGVGIISGLLAGTYPAFYLSRIKPSIILKQNVTTRENTSLRQLLVVAQFAFAIIMITATIVNYRQMHFIRNTDLGYDREQLVTVDINSQVLREKYETVKATFQDLPNVKSVTASTRVPGEWKWLSTISAKKERSLIEFLYFAGDEDFLPTYDIQLTEGRNFRHIPADSAKILINETAVKTMGLTDPVGKVIEFSHFNQDELDQPFVAEVIGVFKDVHFQSVHKKVTPSLITYYRNPHYPIDYYTLQIGTEDLQQTIAAIEEVTQTFDPANPLEYHFLDDKFEELYRADTKTGEIISIAAFLAIVIACLGLFGLINLSVEQRIKEVGIRKVLGAGVGQITWLISRKFLRLVGIAFVLAAPFAWWATQEWLNEFAYHFNVSFDLLLISGGTVLLIAIFTISFQTIKAALANPAESLRYE
ncbi:putative ABC transport system permease protein [Catalinimonas alkaloidigena]|uniref:ABC transporter permease n=1 Tax=Catalinimonas alkaloidigena TaxID=1075417 RepID=UPI0024075BAC|nr:ABC transporter permease [Catalinimonas alkaloidigena]MDF9796768.1 putative ABC transport system permease protein [Catalinimonas alkaloidigena]